MYLAHDYTSCASHVNQLSSLESFPINHDNGHDIPHQTVLGIQLIYGKTNFVRTMNLVNSIPFRHFLTVLYIDRPRQTESYDLGQQFCTPNVAIKLFYQLLILPSFHIPLLSCWSQMTTTFPIFGSVVICDLGPLWPFPDRYLRLSKHSSYYVFQNASKILHLVSNMSIISLLIHQFPCNLHLKNQSLVMLKPSSSSHSGSVLELEQSLIQHLSRNYVSGCVLITLLLFP